jgi:hypothetical protein
MNTAPLTPGQLAEIEELGIPVNEYLKRQREKYGSPDTARLAELRSAEESAGLGAFARGMLDTRNGTGFGAVFGRAAADYSDAKMGRADKRREYEDRREDISRQLELASGQEQRADFNAQQQYRQGERQFNQSERQFDLGVQKDNRALKNDAVKESNQNTYREAQLDLDNKKLQLQAQAIRISADVRRDGLNASNQAKIERLYQTAKEIAIKEAESLHGKTEMLDGTINPQKAAAKQRTMEIAFEREYARLNSIFGRGEGAATAPTGAVRGTFGQ